MNKKHWSTNSLVRGAMCVAISFVLSMIPLFRMPQGGSITPASMLPMVLFCLSFGPWRGMAAGCAYGLLQLLLDPYVIHPVQLLMDYPLAYAVMALACLANLLPKKLSRLRLPVAVLLAFIGRCIMAVLSGVIFFADYDAGQNVWAYSIVYNAAYLAPDCLVCMLISLVPGLEKLMKQRT